MEKQSINSEKTDQALDSALAKRSAHEPKNPDLIHQLRSLVGNRAGSRFMQTKLQVSRPGDQYEQEADRVADQVMRMPDPTAAREPIIGGALPRISRLQRKCEQCEEEEIQRQPMEGKMEEDEESAFQAKEVAGQTPQVSPAMQARISSLQGGGEPLPASSRDFFEPRFGRDFSQVRVHTGAPDAESARSVNAAAFTIGRDIVFGSGRYSPGTEAGDRLLAHELTHVVQQTGAHSPSSHDTMLQRSISSELDKIEDYLSYGLFDWAITDEEAIKALNLLKSLSKYEQAVFLSNAKYADRLRDNLPAGRVAELDEIERNVANIKPPSSTVKEVRSNLSYGLFDWAITDKEAIESLEKLKKLSGVELGVALAAIDYSRLLDNLPDSRKQELVDLMARGLATSGAEEQAHPGATLSSIRFKSDHDAGGHGFIKDNRKNWENSGNFYGEPEWMIDKKLNIISNPISHNKGETVRAELNLNVLPLAAPSAPVTLRGESDDPALSFAFSGSLQGGMNQKLLLDATSPLPGEIKMIPQKQIRWIMKWNDWDREIARSSHTVFVTMDRPLNSSEVTYKRMAKAVEIIGALHTLVPHDIVKGIMRNWNVYNLGKIYGNDFWELADNIADGAQCIDLVRFVMGLIQTVGCPGTATPLIIWAHPSAPGVPIETVYGTGGGMSSLGGRPDHPDWFVTLLDGDFHSNNFEAALKFDHGGVLAYYPGGVNAVFSTALEVLHVFNCMAWIRGTGGLGCGIMDVPTGGEYQPGSCAAGSEHTCFVERK